VLYHGTSADLWDEIRERGLLPRAVTGRHSNWSGDVESREGFAYLSDAYPVYYAAAAATRTGSDLLIVRVEVQEAELYPDEDFIAWSAAKGNPQLQKSLVRHIDPARYRKFWPDSLAYHGTACTKRVAPERITGHRIIRCVSPAVYELGGDTFPEPLGYYFLGPIYREAVASLVEHGENAAVAVVRERFRAVAGAQ